MALVQQEEFEALEERIRTILPEAYQDCYEDVQPVSMGSAGLKFGRDGRVAWDEIWGSFCDLAMAGGPPHKGRLLEPGSREENGAHAEQYLAVVTEICRGIFMVAELAAGRSTVPGWVRVNCPNQGMAEWLTRAIVMENVSVRYEGAALIELPAGPHYRLEKEIKNVITAIAKTSHYWVEHMWSAQQRRISELFREMSVQAPLIQPAVIGYGFDADTHRVLHAKIGDTIFQKSGLLASRLQYAGWLGVECSSVRMAIWIMRALVASNIMARREETTLFIPVNPASDPDGDTVVQSLLQIHEFAIKQKVI